MPFNISFSKNTIPGAAKKEAMFTLTNLGRQQVDTLEGAETEFDILAVMATRKAWSIDDIAKEAKLPDNKVRYELQLLVKKGFVKPIGQTGE